MFFLLILSTQCRTFFLNLVIITQRINDLSFAYFVIFRSFLIIISRNKNLKTDKKSHFTEAEYPIKQSY